MPSHSQIANLSSIGPCWTKFKTNSNWISIVFIQEKAFQNVVYNNSTRLFRLQYVMVIHMNWNYFRIIVIQQMQKQDLCRFNCFFF